LEQELEPVITTSSGKENGKTIGKNGMTSSQVKSECKGTAANKKLHMDIAVAPAQTPEKVGAGNKLRKPCY